MANRERGGRRVKARVDSAGLAWADHHGSDQAAAGLSLQGIQCEIFADTGFDPLDHLLPCLGDESNEVDRYDGRLLLDEHPGRRTPPRSAPILELEDATEAELNAERYADLNLSRNGEPDGASAAWGGDKGQANNPEFGDGSAAATLAAVPFSYENAAGAGNAASSAEAEVAALNRLPDEPFRPSFRIPEELAGACPETERVHKIVAQTAKYVREAAQIEFVLRVKQAGNPNFDFLMPRDRLHPYFRWLVEANPEAHSSSATASATEPQSSALGMLSTYGSDSLGTPTAASKPTTPFQQDSAQAISAETQPDVEPPAAQASCEGPAEASVAKSESLGAGDVGPIAGGNAVSAPLAAGQQQSRAGGSASSAPDNGRMPDAPAAAASQPIPPADVLQIMERLVAFIKKNGAKFEASVRQRERTNTRFAFLHPDTEHHLYYRQLVRNALGSDEAEAILPAMPSANPAPAPVSIKLPAPSSKSPSAQPSASAAAQEPARAAAPAPSAEASRPALHGATVVEAPESRPLPPWLRADAAAAKPSPIRANPSVVRGLLKMHGPEPDPDAAAPAAKAAHLEEVGRESPPGDADPMEAAGAHAEGEAPPRQSAAERTAEEDRRAAEEERKAQRRRLARELMLARRQQQLVKDAQERKRRVNDIAQHRSAFTLDEDDYKVSDGVAEQPEAGELHAESLKAVLPQPAEKPSLPKLEDILRTRRQETALHMHQLSTLSPERDEIRKQKRRNRSSSSDGSEERRAHDKAKRKQRARSESSSSDSSSHSDSDRDARKGRRRDNRRGREDDGRSRRRRDVTHKSKKGKHSRRRSRSRSDRRKSAKRHRRKESGSDDSGGGAVAGAPASSTALSEDLRAKVRALLG